MQKHFLYAYLAVLVLVNIVWAVIPVGNEQFEQKNIKQDWGLVLGHVQQPTDLQSVMRSGFWGQGDIGAQSSSVGSVKDMEQAEAQKLRAKVKAIIHRNQQAYVLLSDGKMVYRISKGEILKDSDWVLIDAGNDWLILQRQGNEGAQERLKLFSKVDTEKASKHSSSN